MFVVLFWKSLVAFGIKFTLPSKEENQQPTRPNWEISVDFELGNGLLMAIQSTWFTLCIYDALFNFSKSQMSNLHNTNFTNNLTDMLEFLTFHIFGKIVMKSYELYNRKLTKKWVVVSNKIWWMWNIIVLFLQTVL